MTKIEELKAAYEAANKPLPKWDDGQGKATHEFMEHQALPLTLWEVSYVCQGERLYRVEVSPITVTRYDISPGASIKSIEFKDGDGRRARGSVGDYYTTEESARAEADYSMAASAKEEAKEILAILMYDHLPTLLEAAAVLDSLRRDEGLVHLMRHDQVERMNVVLENLK